MDAFIRERQSGIIFNLWEQNRVHQKVSLPVKNNLLHTFVVLLQIMKQHDTRLSFSH